MARVASSASSRCRSSRSSILLSMTLFAVDRHHLPSSVAGDFLALSSTSARNPSPRHKQQESSGTRDMENPPSAWVWRPAREYREGGDGCKKNVRERETMNRQVSLQPVRLFGYLRMCCG